ncbi:MAG TPA: alpha/beta hydrolase [Streptosporangiaceae bacterium]|jgi:pimeloyl-ACP methyl ester carboxylesterase
MILSAQVYGEGPLLVLLPWFGLSSGMMAAACEPAVADSGWRRAYLDLPGTGKSAPVLARSDAVASAVAESIEDLAEGAPVALAGCSYGGYIAAELARRHPDRVAGLLMICSGIKILPAERDLTGVAAPEPEPGWLDAVPEQFREHLSLAVGCQSRPVGDRLAAAYLVNGPADEQYLRDLRATGYQLAAESELSALTVTATVAAGRRDRIAGFRDQFRLAAGNSAADYVLFHDVGHYLPFERPERFRALALDWLRRCRPAMPA